MLTKGPQKLRAYEQVTNLTLCDKMGPEGGTGGPENGQGIEELKYENECLRRHNEQLREEVKNYNEICRRIKARFDVVDLLQRWKGTPRLPVP